MKRECRPFWEGLVQLSLGQPDAAAQAHCEGCDECAAKLSELTEMHRVFSLKFFAPPSSAVAAAQGLFVPPPRRAIRLLSSSLAGARSVAEAFQCIYELDAVRIRLMVQPEAGRWRVMGRVEGGMPELELDNEPVVVDAEGRFETSVGRPDPELWISLDGTVSMIRLGEAGDDA